MDNKKLSDGNSIKERIGKKGENEVIQIINRCIQKHSINAKLFNNVILEYNSVYNKLSVEIDHIIVVGRNVIIVETKNAKFERCKYDNKNWRLANNGRKVSNPIRQNRWHKAVFCDRFQLDPQQVVTIEVLLRNEIIEPRTKYPNDYILGVNNYQKGLELLVFECNNGLLLDDLCCKLKDLESKSFKRREKHEDTIMECLKIQKIIKKETGRIFALTDRVKCPMCNGELVFRHRGNDKESYFWGCNIFPECRKTLNLNQEVIVIKSNAIEEDKHIERDLNDLYG